MLEDEKKKMFEDEKKDKKHMVLKMKREEDVVKYSSFNSLYSFLSRVQLSRHLSNIFIT